MAGDCTHRPHRHTRQTTRAHTPHATNAHDTHQAHTGGDTAATSRPEPGMAGNCPLGPQSGLMRDHPPPQPADPSQEWWGTTPTALSQDWQGTVHQHDQWTQARSDRERHPRLSARFGEGPSTTTSSGRQPGVAGNRTQGPQPGLVRDHLPPKPADATQEWRGTAPTALS